MHQILYFIAMKMHLEQYLPQLAKRELFTICDSNVVDYIGVDRPDRLLVIEASEEAKTLATVERIWRWLSDNGATRSAVLINIGGFAAATYLRGIDYVNFPTTLLAMVDAGIGGKTGVNFNGLKNRIGAFRMPLATVNVHTFLESLPAEQMLSGYGEILKTALLKGSKTYAQALRVLETLSRDAMHNVSTSGVSISKDLTDLITTCCKYKSSIVRKDPEEKTGLRKVLNFGHTIGHALEEAQMVHGTCLHGYCVLWGMIAELYLSVALLGCPKELLQQLTKVMLDYYGRPQCDCKQQDKLIDLMRADKKNNSTNEINFTLLHKAGDPVIDQVASEDLIKESLDYLFTL